jgi:plasmid stabilization system protein ParE
MECIFSERAARDLKEIGDYIARDDPQRAVSYVQELRARGRKIAGMPGAPLIVDQIGDLPVRKVLFGRYRIYYSWHHEQNVVVILHIRHGARSEPEFGS